MQDYRGQWKMGDGKLGPGRGPLFILRGQNAVTAWKVASLSIFQVQLT
jgi:hypothetical protein